MTLAYFLGRHSSWEAVTVDKRYKNEGHQPVCWQSPPLLLAPGAGQPRHWWGRKLLRADSTGFCYGECIPDSGKGQVPTQENRQAILLSLAVTLPPLK